LSPLRTYIQPVPETLSAVLGAPVTEGGMMRLAIVESAAAIAVALFEVAVGLEHIASAVENDLSSSVDRVARAGRDD
jgi:hypothetical protein